MKPIFIYENENCEKITISRERFEKLINEAYESGRKDGFVPTNYNPPSGTRNDIEKLPRTISSPSDASGDYPRPYYVSGIDSILLK